MEKNILLERLKIRKPPTEFQDVCLKTFCAARATLELGGFQCWRSYTQAICCVEGFSLWELAFVPPFSGLLLFMHASFIWDQRGPTWPDIFGAAQPLNIVDPYLHFCLSCAIGLLSRQYQNWRKCMCWNRQTVRHTWNLPALRLLDARTMRAAPTLAVDLRAIAAAVHATGIQRQRGGCVNIWAFLWRITSGLCGETTRNLRNNFFSRDEVEKAVNVIHVVSVTQQGSCNVSIGIHHCISTFHACVSILHGTNPDGFCRGQRVEAASDVRLRLLWCFAGLFCFFSMRHVALLRLHISSDIWIWYGVGIPGTQQLRFHRLTWIVLFFPQPR